VTTQTILPAAGTAAPKVPFGFVGTWTPPSQYGTLISSPMTFTAASWTTEAPPGSNQDAPWDWATNLGQVIAGNWYPWGTDVQIEESPYCAPLYYPGNAPKSGPSQSINNALISQASVNMIVKTCVPSSTTVPAQNIPAVKMLQELISMLESVIAELST